MIQLFEANAENRGLVLDPRTKLFAMLTIVIYVTGGVGNVPELITIALAITPLILLCTAKKWVKALIYTAVFAVAWVYMFFFADTLNGAFGYVLSMVSVVVYRMLPGLVMGAYIFSSTTVSEFMAAMRKMHVSNKIAIPLSVMFRLFPTVVEEFFSINSAMSMRDIRVGGKNAGKMIEYRLVPLMVCSVNIGNELSAAALTRGLSVESVRTNICKIGFHLADAIIFAEMLVPFAYVILKLVGVTV